MAGESLDVFLTVDVEHAGSSYARGHPEKRHAPLSLACGEGDAALGLPYITETLRRRGFKATFFTETLSTHYFGKEPMARAVEGLLGAGHDVQLHAHPAWLRFADGRERADRLHAFPAEEQQEILAEARRLLIEVGAPAPSAFRAGGFGADDKTYGVLEALGFTLSSSYNLSALGGDCRISERGRRNDAFAVTPGMVEIPLTTWSIRDPRRGFRFGDRQLQVGAARFPQSRTVLEGCRAAGFRSAVLLFHNFEFVTRKGPEWFLGPFKPNLAVMKAFESLLDFLAAHPDRFRVRTFGDLDEAWRKSVAAGRGGDLVPRSGGFYWPM